MEKSIEKRLAESTVRVAKSIVLKLKEDMLASPVDDITIISRPQIEVIEAAIEIAGRQP